MLYCAYFNFLMQFEVDKFYTKETFTDIHMYVNACLLYAFQIIKVL